MVVPFSQIISRFEERCKNILSRNITMNDEHFFLCFINKTLMICLFINILLLVRRKSSKLLQRRRNEKSLRTIGI